MARVGSRSYRVFSEWPFSVLPLVGIGEDILRPQDVVLPLAYPYPMHRGHALPAKIHSRIALSKETVPRVLTRPACPVSSERLARRFLPHGYRCRSIPSATPTWRAGRIPHCRPAATATRPAVSACETQRRLPSFDREAYGGEFRLKVSVRVHL